MPPLESTSPMGHTESLFGGEEYLEEVLGWALSTLGARDPSLAQVCGKN